MTNRNVKKAYDWFKKHENKNIRIWHFSGLLNVTMNLNSYSVTTGDELSCISLVAKEGCYTLISGDEEDSYCFTLDKNKMRDDFDAFIIYKDTEVGVEIM